MTFCSKVSIAFRFSQHFQLSVPLTSFDADVGAADFARLVFGGAEVVVVMDVAVVGGGRERVQLKSTVGLHMTDVGHVVNVVASGQVPA